MTMKKKIANTALIAAAVALATAIACTAIPESALTAGPEQCHRAHQAAKAIRQSAERNPINFDDRISGAEICVWGRAGNIKWGTGRNEPTYVTLISGSSSAAPSIECKLNRQDAAQLTKDEHTYVTGVIRQFNEGEHSRDKLPLSDCKLTTRHE